MSFTPLMGLMVARLTDSLPPNSTVIELGNQTLKMTDEILDKVISEPPKNANISALQKIRALKIKQRGDKTADYYKALGFSEYAAIDVNDKYGSLMMDLNLDLKQDYGFTKQYDLVTNNGTGEHLFNQYAVFKNCHDLAKVNGIILFILPFAGWVNHGFFNFHPVLFRDLAGANNYKIEYAALGNRWGHTQTLTKNHVWWKNSEPMKLEVSKILELAKNPGSDPFVIAAMRKQQESEFKMPIQGIYVGDVTSGEINQRYSSEVKKANLQAEEKLTTTSNNSTFFAANSTINYSLLQRATKADIMLEPYPYMVIENALPEDLYQTLAKEYPSYDTIVRGRPLKNLLQYEAREIFGKAENTISPLWLEFFKYHTSQNFFKEVMHLFGDVIRQEYPDLESRIGGKLEGMTTGVRYRDKADIGLDSIFGINPQPTPDYIRGHHVDEPTELYAMLLYMRPEHDNSDGGSLEIYRFKGDRPVLRGVSVSPQDVELVRTVKYQPNTLFFFINTTRSVHAVTGHPMTNNTFRRYVNVCGELSIPLWDKKNPNANSNGRAKSVSLSEGIDTQPMQQRIERSESHIQQTQKELEKFQIKLQEIKQKLGNR